MKKLLLIAALALFGTAGFSQNSVDIIVNNGCDVQVTMYYMDDDCNDLGSYTYNIGAVNSVNAQAPAGAKFTSAKVTFLPCSNPSEFFMIAPPEQCTNCVTGHPSVVSAKLRCGVHCNILHGEWDCNGNLNIY